MLIGDRNRELATRALRRHYLAGRITAAELADRVELTLRARSRRELHVAMDGLPLVWEDLPGGVHTAARRVRGGVLRVRFFFKLVRMWFKLNLALLVACGVALVIGAPAGKTLGATVAAWALATFGLFWFLRRGATPSLRVAVRRK
jgi:Domain of unknown function (DUF1707)